MWAHRPSTLPTEAPSVSNSSILSTAVEEQIATEQLLCFFPSLAAGTASMQAPKLHLLYWIQKLFTTERSHLPNYSSVVKLPGM